MKNTLIIWSLTSSLMSVCMEGKEVPLLVKQQGWNNLLMEVDFERTIGEAAEQIARERGLLGPWALGHGGKVLSDSESLADAALGAESAVELIPLPLDHMAMEEKQPIFKVTFENEYFEREYGVKKVDMFLQYVSGQNIRGILATTFDGSANAKLIKFRILATSVEEPKQDDFFQFDPHGVVVKMRAQPDGLSERQQDLVYLQGLWDFLRIPTELYFPIFNTQLKDVSLPFNEPLPLFLRQYQNGNHCILSRGSFVTFERVVFGSDAAPDVPEMVGTEFLAAGSEIQTAEELRARLKLATARAAKLAEERLEHQEELEKERRMREALEALPVRGSMPHQRQRRRLWRRLVSSSSCTCRRPNRLRGEDADWAQ